MDPLPAAPVIPPIPPALELTLAGIALPRADGPGKKSGTDTPSA